MKNLLKSILFIVILFSIALPCNAQLRLGIKGGLNVSTLSGFEDVVKRLDAKMGTTGLIPANYSIGYTPGLHLGMVMQYDFSQQFFLQPELMFSMQGAKETGDGVKENEAYLNFIQLPIYAGYKINAGSNLDVILGVGPYLAYGIAGGEGSYGDNGQFTRFDAGLSAMGGIQFNKIQIIAGYDLGLVDQLDFSGWDSAKDMYSLPSVYNRNIKISCGYFF